MLRKNFLERKKVKKSHKFNTYTISLKNIKKTQEKNKKVVRWQK